MSATTEWCPVCGHRLGHGPGPDINGCPDCDECNPNPSDDQIEAMYAGPSARETYMADWRQHQELHRR